jgi:hypothetical protein
MSFDIFFEFKDGSEETFRISCKKFHSLNLCRSSERSHADNIENFQMYHTSKKTGIFNGSYHDDIVKIMFINCINLKLVNTNRYDHPVKLLIFDV